MRGSPSARPRRSGGGALSLDYTRKFFLLRVWEAVRRALRLLVLERGGLLLFVRVREVLAEREGVRGGVRLRLTRVAEREEVADMETEAEELGGTEAEGDMELLEEPVAEDVAVAVREALAVTLGVSGPVAEEDAVPLDEPVIDWLPVPVCEEEGVLAADAVTDPVCEEEGVFVTVEV